ncbi:MAG: hypothetical protein LRY62_02375 [Alphaproteobacteria bacterium]|nr:hypothetical protein [Alphaproteobacteria bacterium]
MKMRASHHPESGNILWFILIGIVLIGLLTALVSRGTSSVDQSGDVEQMRIVAGQIMQTAKSFESAISNMKMNGISESDISFQNNATAVDYTNANCTNVSCRIFESGGAGLAYVRPPPNALTTTNTEWIFTGANNVGSTDNPVGTTAAGSGNDLLMLLPNITQGVCRQINRLMDVNGPSYDPPVDDGISFDEFTGTYDPSTPITILEGTTAGKELDGKSAGCFFDTVTNGYYFYQVILER